MDVIDRILKNPAANDEAIRYHIIETLNTKKEKSGDSDFTKWANKLTKILAKNLAIKLK